MNTKLFVIVGLLFCAFGIAQAQDTQTTTIGSPAAVETPANVVISAVLPPSLSGRWQRINSREGQKVSIRQINASTGLLTWYSARWTPGCDLLDVPAAVKYDGSKLEIHVAQEYVPSLCGTAFVAILNRQPDGTFKGTASRNYQLSLTLQPS
jgi:hypothetical protein